MKIKKTLKSVIKKEGKESLSYRRIAKLKTSREFGYLVDTSRA
ncbi:MAG: hypothetical protein U9R27_00795 [Campylobacterota bacterium]|nr:hypothetical protein [Campylobacterota bacterium]